MICDIKLINTWHQDRYKYNLILLVRSDVNTMNHVCRYTCLNEKKKNPLPSLTSAMCRQIRMNLNQSNHSHLKVGEKKLLCRMTKLISQGGGVFGD